jgi:hypothetical protein
MGDEKSLETTGLWIMNRANDDCKNGPNYNIRASGPFCLTKQKQKCLLPFGSESFVIPPAVQEFKG